MSVRAFYDYSSMALAVGVFRSNRERNIYERLTDDGWVRHVAGEYAPATVYLEPDAAKTLAEHLHAAGVIPDSELQSEGHKGALEFHLADMRRLLAHATGAPLPERKP